ncbi:MAG: DUF2461 domain-containing protein [Thermoplasmatota archaeon]
MSFKQAIPFLAELQANNRKEWFTENKNRFEAAVQAPALEFVEACGDWFEAAGLPYRAEPKKSGGSLSRIFRDARFSEDKSPYNSYFFIHFAHKAFPKKVPGPVLGVRFDSEGVGVGAGLYGGPTPVLNKIRDHIIANPEGWKAATKNLELWGDSLKTAPKGYPKEHPLIEDIRRKAFMASVEVSRQEFESNLLGTFQDRIPALFPFVEFLREALE